MDKITRINLFREASERPMLLWEFLHSSGCCLVSIFFHLFHMLHISDNVQGIIKFFLSVFLHFSLNAKNLLVILNCFICFFNLHLILL